MTNFIEEQQKEAQLLLVLHMLSGELGGNAGDYQLSPQDLDRTIKITITNTLNHILESGLLEEYGNLPETPPEFKQQESWANTGHNTLARAIKEFISNMDSV